MKKIAFIMIRKMNLVMFDQYEEKIILNRRFAEKYTKSILILYNKAKRFVMFSTGVKLVLQRKPFHMRRSFIFFSLVVGIHQCHAGKQLYLSARRGYVI